jgi:hypothetical protein
MKLNKIKISRLTNAQAKAVNGGYGSDSTQHNFTCGWCTSNDNTYQINCSTQNNGQNTCYHC